MTFKKKILMFTLVMIFLLASIFFPYDLFVKQSYGMFVTHEELEELLEDNWVLSANISNFKYTYRGMLV